MEGNRCGLINVLSSHLPGGTDKKQENFSKDSQCPR
jgi:hypothetical protein